MMTFLHVALANLAVATLLAVLAVLAGRFSRRPALVHSLWLLVLLKMITPPLVPLRIIPWPEQPAVEESEPVADRPPEAESPTPTPPSYSGTAGVSPSTVLEL